MGIVALSFAEFSASKISFSNPQLRQQLAECLHEYRDAGLETLTLLHRNGESPERCDGGMIVPLSAGRIITAVWPLADSPETEAQLLDAYADRVAQMSPPRVATLLSEVNVSQIRQTSRRRHAPLTQIVRYRLTDFSDLISPDNDRNIKFVNHASPDETVIELLKLTEEGSHDIAELLQLTDWNERLAGYQGMCPRDALRIASMSEKDSRVGVAVWSCDPRSYEAELHYLGVPAAVRRRGWGRKLLQHICGTARARGARSIGLNVDRRNHAAIGLYESVGFQGVLYRRLWISEEP